MPRAIIRLYPDAPDVIEFVLSHVGHRERDEAKVIGISLRLTDLSTFNSLIIME
jgi:hypothetical protein